MSFIRLESVYFSYDSKDVLFDVGFDIMEGDIFAIVGKSGSGKSTLLKITAAIYQPSRGRVFFEEKSVADMNEDEIFKLQSFSSFVFQYGSLISNMNVFDNISLPIKYFMHVEDDKLSDMIKNLMESFDLPFDADFLRLLPAHLSVGERKLVAIVRALITNPKVVFFDDPFANLDMERVMKIKNIILKLKNKGVTTVFVTSNINYALSIASRICVMDNGRVVRVGATRDIQESDDPKVLSVIKGLSSEEAILESEVASLIE